MLQVEIKLIFIPNLCYTVILLFCFPVDKKYLLTAPTLTVESLKISHSAHVKPWCKILTLCPGVLTHELLGNEYVSSFLV